MILKNFGIIVIALLLHTNNLAAREYIVRGDSDYAPFSYIDKTGNPSGLEIDILEAISALYNLKLNYQLSSWPTAISNIEQGDADIIVGIIYDDRREEFLDFTIPLHTEHYSIFIRKDLPFEGLNSLHNYKLVALEQDASIEKYLIPMGLYNNYLLAESLPRAFFMIELGMADYVLAPNLLGINILNHNNYKNIEQKGPAIIPSIYCFAVKKGDTALLSRLNKGILELRKNGKLLEIQKKWNINVEGDLKHKRIAENIWIITGVIALIVFVVFIWIGLLRIQIKRKTASLNRKNQELQESEEKFRIITENASDIIWHLDSNFCLTYISPADERIRGFKNEEIIGKSIFSILKPEGIELLKKANLKRKEDLSKGIQSAPSTYELEELCKDGSYVWIEATATAFYDQEGNITGYHGVSRDISKRKKAELLLKEQEKQLRELNATKDKLFSIIAHDLRNPFNAILGLSDILLENTRKLTISEARNYLKLIYSSAESTLVLLDNLLSWAKSQSGQYPFSPTQLNLNAVILVLCKELVKRHGGAIWFTSKSGKGSAFSFSLPAHI